MPGRATPSRLQKIQDKEVSTLAGHASYNLKTESTLPGLKCFQRSNGESIPGCDVSTAPGKDWDYCYDPIFELNQLFAAEKFTHCMQRVRRYA